MVNETNVSLKVKESEDEPVADQATAKVEKIETGEEEVSSRRRRSGSGGSSDEED